MSSTTRIHPCLSFVSCGACLYVLRHNFLVLTIMMTKLHPRLSILTAFSVLNPTHPLRSLRNRYWFLWCSRCPHVRSWPLSQRQYTYNPRTRRTRQMPSGTEVPTAFLNALAHTPPKSLKILQLTVLWFFPFVFQIDIRARPAHFFARGFCAEDRHFFHQQRQFQLKALCPIINLSSRPNSRISYKQREKERVVYGDGDLWLAGGGLGTTKHLDGVGGKWWA